MVCPKDKSANNTFNQDFLVMTFELHILLYHILTPFLGMGGVVRI